MNRAENPIRVPRKVALALVGSLILPIAACNNDEGATTTTTLAPENPIVIQNDEIIRQNSQELKLLKALNEGIQDLNTKYDESTSTTTTAPGTAENSAEDQALIDEKIGFYVDDFNRNNQEVQITAEDLIHLIEIIPTTGIFDVFAEDYLGGIEPHPENITILREGPDADLNVPRNAFSYSSSGEMTISIGDKEIARLTEGEGDDVVNLVFYFNAGDRNQTVHLSEYANAHVLVTQGQPTGESDPEASRIWTAQQLKWAENTPNASDGALRQKLIGIDVDTGEILFVVERNLGGNPDILIPSYL